MKIHKLLSKKIKNYLDKRLVERLRNRVLLLEQNEKSCAGFFEFCFFHDVKENTVLLIEPNDCHGEVIPGYARYILDLGYNLDIVMIPIQSEMKPLCRIKDAKVNFYAIPFSYFNALFANKDKLNKYKALFFTSNRIYKSMEDNKSPVLLDHFPKLIDYADKIFTVEHHFDSVNDDWLRADRVITICDIYKERQIAVNPHFFGEAKITGKSEGKTVFIMVGAIDAKRRNCRILISAVEKLHKCDIRNFKVIIIGKGELGIFPKAVKKYFDIRGRIPYQKMYEAMEQADFFLPLLDPENPKHDRYLTSATSGSFQLIYGFRKPCLIQEKFITRSGFDGNNALVYSANCDLAGTMKKAIEMTPDDYHAMQENLLKLSSSIENKSREVMKRMFKYGQF